MNDASPAVSEKITVEYTEHVAVVTMVHRPYNLSGPDLYRTLLDAFEAAVKAGSRAILLKSGLRHFCAGADVSLWDERIANQGKARIDPID
jgi:enoyl-CoA hydratase/carnithine racemase